MPFTVDQASAVRLLIREIADCTAAVQREPDGERRDQLRTRITGCTTKIAVYLDAADGWRSMRPESRHGIWPEDYAAQRDVR